MNKYTNACRAHWAKGAKMKADDQKIVGRCIKSSHLKPRKCPVYIHYSFFEQPNRGKLRDKSNISGFAIKVIEDALQEHGIIQNDNWEYMRGYSCTFWRVTDNPRIKVEIEDA